jgi:hypothetical protein
VPALVDQGAAVDQIVEFTPGVLDTVRIHARLRPERCSLTSGPLLALDRNQRSISAGLHNPFRRG